MGTVKAWLNYDRISEVLNRKKVRGGKGGGAVTIV